MDDIVIVYKLERFAGDEVFNDFRFDNFERNVVVPINTNPDVKAAKNNFYSFESTIRAAGTEDYNVYFALYRRDNDGQPKLYGYYYWDPRIIVAG